MGLKTYYEKAVLTDKEMDAGVLIEVPKDMLKKVQIGGTVVVTILDGFGSKFEDVKVEDEAVAYLTYNGSGDMELETKDSSSLNAIVSGTDELEVDAKDSSTFVIQGDITEGEAKEEATLKIAEGSTIEDWEVDVKGKKATVIVDSSIEGGAVLSMTRTVVPARRDQWRSTWTDRSTDRAPSTILATIASIGVPRSLACAFLKKILLSQKVK